MPDQQPAQPAARPGTESPTRRHDEQAATPTPCPYCGLGLHAADLAAGRCPGCLGRLDPLSKQATQNAMGPWFVRDDARPHQPGFNTETLRKLVAKGRVTRGSVVRGPTTRQFWTRAVDTPGVAVLLGVCHACGSPVRPDEFSCPVCDALLSPRSDRQTLGLAPVRLLPGEAPPSVIAHAAADTASDGRAERPETPGDHPQPSARAEAREETAAAPAAPSPPGTAPPAHRARRWLWISVAANTLLAIALAAALSDRSGVRFAWETPRAGLDRSAEPADEASNADRASQGVSSAPGDRPAAAAAVTGAAERGLSPAPDAATSVDPTGPPENGSASDDDPSDALDALAPDLARVDELAASGRSADLRRAIELLDELAARLPAGDAASATIASRRSVLARLLELAEQREALFPGGRGAGG